MIDSLATDNSDIAMVFLNGSEVIHNLWDVAKILTGFKPLVLRAPGDLGAEIFTRSELCFLFLVLVFLVHQLSRLSVIADCGEL